MKKKIRTWMIRLTATFLLIAVLLVIILLNPALSYAGKTRHNNITILHDEPLDPLLLSRLDQAIRSVSSSEYYDPHWSLQLCLNDGSRYPFFVRQAGGRAFGRGFYNKVVLMGAADPGSNRVSLNGYSWNLQQLLAHEMIHCFQLHKRGLLRSKPLADIPDWKWEGYAEWIARRGEYQRDLRQNIARLIEVEKTAHNGWIRFSDGTGAPILYYRWWLMVGYCMEVKKMTYDAVIDDPAPQESVWKELMDWYGKKQVENGSSLPEWNPEKSLWVFTGDFLPAS